MEGLKDVILLLAALCWILAAFIFGLEKGFRKGLETAMQMLQEEIKKEQEIKIRKK